METGATRANARAATLARGFTERRLTLPQGRSRFRVCCYGAAFVRTGVAMEGRDARSLLRFSDLCEVDAEVAAAKIK